MKKIIQEAEQSLAALIAEAEDIKSENDVLKQTIVALERQLEDAEAKITDLERDIQLMEDDAKHG